MFEEVCLVCGKHLLDDRRAYCSDECQSVDTSSPSISSASSAFSSPHMEYATGGDVPALVPSALGSALSNYQARDRYSSSSASSTSWSVVTDDEDDCAILCSADNGYISDANSYDGNSKSLRLLRPSGLNYARRPSGTNNRSTITTLHRRASSSSGLCPAKDLHPNELPITSSEDDDDAVSRLSYDVPQNFTPSPSSFASHDRKATITTKTKRSRNRASLPAYFSLLQVNSSSPRSSPLSASSGMTIARYSPPTPKLGLSSLTNRLSHTSRTPSAVEATPRGRRREPRRSPSSHRSRSRSVSLGIPEEPPSNVRGRIDSKSSVEQVFDWSSAIARGRPPLRRNSSPPQRMILRKDEIHDYISRDAGGRRGRLRLDELEGEKSATRAPGFGNGRSGLKDRQRDMAMGLRGLSALR